MKTLTVSELNAALIEKGFSGSYTNYIPENKWGADSFVIYENGNGMSYLQLMKKVSQYRCLTVVSYSKLKAFEKHEVANFLLSIK